MTQDSSQIPIDVIDTGNGIQEKPLFEFFELLESGTQSILLSDRLLLRDLVRFRCIKSDWIYKTFSGFLHVHVTLY